MAGNFFGGAFFGGGFFGSLPGGGNRKRARKRRIETGYVERELVESIPEVARRPFVEVDRLGRSSAIERKAGEILSESDRQIQITAQQLAELQKISRLKTKSSEEEMVLLSILSSL